MTVDDKSSPVCREPGEIGVIVVDEDDHRRTLRLAYGAVQADMMNCTHPSIVASLG